MSFEQFSGVNALFTLIVVVTAAVIVIAQTRKTSRELLIATAQDWQGIATARNERIEMLTNDLKLLDQKLLQFTSRYGEVEKEKAFLTNQNIQLQQQVVTAQRRVSQLEEHCRRAGLALPATEG